MITNRDLRFMDESDYSLKITLKEADGSFLSKLASPAASIVNRKSVEKAGKHFGEIPEETPGSGFFRFDGWDYASKMVLSSFDGCWKGEPSCEGLVLLNVEDEEHCRDMFESGELDILDLDRIYAGFVRMDTQSFISSSIVTCQ